MSIFDNKRAILFDLGGTLIEFENEPWENLERIGMKRCHSTLQHYGFDIPDADDFAEIFVEFHTDKWKEIKQDSGYLKQERNGRSLITTMHYKSPLALLLQ